MTNTVAGPDGSGLSEGLGHDKEAALRTKLRAAVPMLMLAIERAQEQHPGATIKLMLAAEEPDGSGHIAARLDTAEFITDVAALVGYTEPSIEERAQFFLGSFGLNGA